MDEDENAARVRANRANWDDRVPIHLGPGGYDVEGLVANPKRLSDAVAHDAPRLGPLSEQRVAHLQCHIGTDTLSLTRLGATCMGLDFSPPALAAARDLATRTGANMTFALGSVLDAASHLPPATFDLVYSTVGTIGWLPDIERWARQVFALLRPGGRLYLRDAHPVLVMLDEHQLPQARVVKYPYGTAAGAIELEEQHTYAGQGTLAHSRTYEWNHSVAEICSALLSAGLNITDIGDEDTMEWAFFVGQPEVRPGRFGLPAGLVGQLPLMLRVQAHKPR